MSHRRYRPTRRQVTYIRRLQRSLDLSPTLGVGDSVEATYKISELETVYRQRFGTQPAMRGGM